MCVTYYCKVRVTKKFQLEIANFCGNETENVLYLLRKKKKKEES